MSESSMRPQPRPEWAGLPFLRVGTEILLGVSFFVTLAFAAIGAAEHRTSIVAELGALVFMCSLTCVLVNWFAAEPQEPRGWE